MPIAYIGLGANLGRPAQQIRSAIDALRGTTGIRLLAQSSLYRSTAIGLPGQPDYCNAVCAVSTQLDAERLLEALIGIEQAAGRVRDGRRWGPRVLDLDLLHMEGVSSTSARLTLPHPEISKRNFVLVPWAEIAPELEIAGVGVISELAIGLGRDGLSLWSD